MLLLWSADLFRKWNNFGRISAFNQSPTANAISGQEQLHFYNVVQEPWALGSKSSPANDVDLLQQLSSPEQLHAGLNWECWAHNAQRRGS